MYLFKRSLLITLYYCIFSRIIVIYCILIYILDCPYFHQFKAKLKVLIVGKIVAIRSIRTYYNKFRYSQIKSKNQF